MKELTIEQKAKAYDEAIERAKEKYAMFEGMKQGDVLEDVFPELKESEDDKIKKQIIYAIKELHVCDETKRKYIAWLEKQGEQNLIMAKSPQLGEQKTTWSEEDEAMWAEISDLLWEGYKQSDSKFSWDDIRNWVNPKLKSLRPQRNVGYNPYKAVVESITKMVKKYESIISNKVDAVDFLNEVRAKCNEAKQYDVKYPQLQWKPSEEHIYWLKWAINRMPDTEKANEAEAVLEDLLEQLKQL